MATTDYQAEYELLHDIVLKQPKHQSPSFWEKARLIAESKGMSIENPDALVDAAIWAVCYRQGRPDTEIALILNQSPQVKQFQTEVERQAYLTAVTARTFASVTEFDQDELHQVQQIIRLLADDLKIHPVNVLENTEAANLIFAVIKKQTSLEAFKAGIAPMADYLPQWDGLGYSSYRIAEDYISLATTGRKFISR